MQKHTHHHSRCGHLPHRAAPLYEPTRQSRRSDLRAEKIFEWRVITHRGQIVDGPKDEHGIMARRVRRSIARAQMKREGKWRVATSKPR